MNLVKELRAMLAPLAAGGAWHAGNQAQPPVYPYIVFLRVSSTDNVSLSGPSDLQNARVQVDIYARSMPDAVEVEGAVLAAFDQWEVPNVRLSAQDLFDDSVKAFRISRDFSVWAKQ